MNWDGAISMSKCLHGMVWVSIQEHNSSATLCHVNQHGLILFGILEGAHCSFVISSPSGLASWTLIVTALLKFLTLSASAILTSDENHMAEMLAGVPTSQTALRERPPQRRWGC